MEMGMESSLGTNGGGVGIGLDAFDHHDLGFEDGDLLDGLTSIPFTPSYDLDAFSSTFEDPFPYPSTDFSLLNAINSDPNNNTSNNQSASNDHSSTNENITGKPDNKLLSFGPVVPKSTILTGNGGQTWPAMTAELYGMFFVAEDVFGEASIPPVGRPMELTCYRRNLFQISGSITLTRGIKSFVNEQGQQLPLYELSTSISAFESIDGKPTEIISVPWKTQGFTGSSDDTLPPRWPLDLSMNPELDPATVSIPIAWKRLQFKHATANNGRRKGLQQHYVIQVNLHGILSTGEAVKLAEIQSGPIIVRGRSPRNFDSRKDVTLGPASSGEKKSEPKNSTDAGGTKDVPVKVDPGVSNGNFKYYALNALQQPLDLPDWNTPSATAPLQSPSLPSATEPHPAKKPVLTHSNSSSSNTGTRPPVPKTRWVSESGPSSNRTNTAHTAPIDLSIAEDEHGAFRRSGSMSGGRPLNIGDKSPQLDRVGARKVIGSPVETADLLYEYFPLSLDDWMPPVDAIYRPHVVHHTVVPPDLKAEHLKNKTKRYFSADD